MTRLQANKSIMDLLYQEVLKSPDLRFTQLLYNLDITRTGETSPVNPFKGKGEYYEDNYNEESAATLRNVINRVNRLNDTGKVQEVS